MGFLRRKSIRKEFDEKLIQQLFKQKEEWNRQKKLVANQRSAFTGHSIRIKACSSEVLFLSERSEKEEFTFKQLEIAGLLYIVLSYACTIHMKRR
ncbi:hypothetical protein BSAF29S_03374 [Bacillus safensis subsp. safensis]